MTNNITQVESDKENSTPNHPARSVGERVNNRKAGARGIITSTKKPNPDDEMLHFMKVMTEDVGPMSNAIAKGSTNGVEDTVREHVKRALVPALSDIAEMKQLIKTYLDRVS